MPQQKQRQPLQIGWVGGSLECVNALKLNNYSTVTLRVVSNVLFVVPAWADDPI